MLPSRWTPYSNYTRSNLPFLLSTNILDHTATVHVPPSLQKSTNLEALEIPQSSYTVIPINTFNQHALSGFKYGAHRPRV